MLNFIERKIQLSTVLFLCLYFKVSEKALVLSKIFEKIKFLMTKSIIITYNEADEGFLMTLFNRFKIATKPVTSAVNGEYVPTKTEFLTNLSESIGEMNAHRRGELELPSIETLLSELAEESAGV